MKNGQMYRIALSGNKKVLCNNYWHFSFVAEEKNIIFHRTKEDFLVFVGQYSESIQIELNLIAGKRWITWNAKKKIDK